MADAISIQELIDARADAKTLEEAVNGDAVTTVLSRLGETYPTLSNALNQIDSKLDSADTQIKQGITNLFENGGLPATPFATKALMTASALVDGDYAMVTDDADNNGLYIKTAGAWVRSAYDPTALANTYTDNKVKGVTNNFKTKALMTASALPNDSYAMVIDDTEANNGWYSKVAGAWVKSGYDPLAQAKADATTKADAAVVIASTNADNKIAAALTKSSGTFDTLAQLTASPLIDGAFALVANDTPAKNGHYKKVSGTWTKTGYDPVSASKKDIVELLFDNPVEVYGQDVFVENRQISSVGRLEDSVDGRHLSPSIPVKKGYKVEINTILNESNLVYYTLINTYGGAPIEYKRASTASPDLRTWVVDIPTDGVIYTQYSAGSEGVSVSVDKGMPRLLDEDKTKKLFSADYVSPLNDLKALRLDGVARASSRLEDGVLVGKTTGIRLGAFSYLFEVEPNTEYTLYSTRNETLHVWDLWEEAPNSWYSALDVDNRVTVDSVRIQHIGSYSTLTTGENDHFLMFDPVNYEDTENGGLQTILLKGEYDPLVWDSITGVNNFTKRTVMDSLKVEHIDSPLFNKSKNIVRNTNLNFGIHSRIPLGEMTERIKETKTGSLLTYAIVKPNTTYTISKESSSRFDVAIANDNDYGVVLLRDSSKREFTFTTFDDTRWLYIETSHTENLPLIQVEEGKVATPYLSRGLSFKGAAEPSIGLLTEDEPIADTGLVTLGWRTSKFAIPTTSTKKEWTESTYIDEYYVPLEQDFPHLITKSVIGKDASGLHDVHMYVFEPDNYEQTVFMQSGVHPVESAPPFALGALLNDIYRYPEKHVGLAYMRNKVRFIVVPTVSPWGMSFPLKDNPEHYLNSNGVNPNRNYPNRWGRIVAESIYDSKGVSPASEAEVQNIMNVLEIYKDEITFCLDFHTGEGWTRDSFAYYNNDDPYIKPAIEQVVSMRNEVVRREEGREPINELGDSFTGMSRFYIWRTLGIPCAAIEFGTNGETQLGSQQITRCTDQAFNYMWEILRSRIDLKRVNDKQIEDNKPYVSLYNSMDGHTLYADEFYTVEQFKDVTYDSLAMRRILIGGDDAVSGVEAFIHEPSQYDNTVVLLAGESNGTKKDVTALAFTTYKLFTDNNPRLLSLINSTRFIIIPSIEDVGEAGLSGDINTSSNPVAVDLRYLMSSYDIDQVIQLGAFKNTNVKPFPEYSLCQILYNNQAKIRYSGLVSQLSSKYDKVIDANAAQIDSKSTSALSNYFKDKGYAYTFIYLSQYILGDSTVSEPRVYKDYGYEANEMAFCAEILLNTLEGVLDRVNISKYAISN